MIYHLTTSRSALLGFATLASLLLFPEPSFAGSFWGGFKQYWGGFFGRQNGIVMATLVLGAVSIFIVTRGKWRK